MIDADRVPLKQPPKLAQADRNTSETDVSPSPSNPDVTAKSRECHPAASMLRPEPPELERCLRPLDAASEERCCQRQRRIKQKSDSRNKIRTNTDTHSVFLSSWISAVANFRGVSSPSEGFQALLPPERSQSGWFWTVGSCSLVGEVRSPGCYNGSWKHDFEDVTSRVRVVSRKRGMVPRPAYRAVPRSSKANQPFDHRCRFWLFW